MTATPFISCLMPTRDRRQFVARAIDYFLRQDYVQSELIIGDDGSDSVADLVNGHPRIRYLRTPAGLSLGAKRNLLCNAAQGEILLHQDDDDWLAPWRISYQVGEILRRGVQVCGLSRLLYYRPKTDQAFLYSYPSGHKPWVAGNTLCYTKAYWSRCPFEDTRIGEDTRFVWRASPSEIAALEDERFVIGMLHDRNASPKCTSKPPWKPVKPSEVHDRLGADLAFYRDATGVRKSALVTAARGIGDIIRVTPLVTVLSSLGYAVDMYVEPDYADTPSILNGGPGLRCVYSKAHTAALAKVGYDVATFTVWTTAMHGRVTATRKLMFDRLEWIRNGDTHCLTNIARQLGWQEPVPAPFAVPSIRRFELPAGTIAFHPGCKPDWPWKKWHGFDELAELFSHVVIVGSEGDRDNHATYFGRTFVWPAHVNDLTGTLSLADTAALLRGCAALVSNDSGMLHLGTALGVPSFGIFGITSPAREATTAANLFPITKGLGCEPACRRQPWGRRDCEWHLACLKTLTPAEVAERVRVAVNEHA
jgi:glycosyltransferase involved in cell wall biosynthesis